eukprot:353572-Chlamydomonas_euryale.AAC.2
MPTLALMGLVGSTNSTSAVPIGVSICGGWQVSRGWWASGGWQRGRRAAVGGRVAQPVSHSRPVACHLSHLSVPSIATSQVV